MGQKQRIRANIGKEQKLTVELNQEFGLLEVLSLKLTQKDIYTSLCSDYGVVCGRISVNNGYGVPNAKVSIFIPQLDIHEDDPVISALYPYKNVTDRSEDGYRYNLLPERKQHGGHEPTGTFPDQTDIIAREEVLEVFETYYKYTVKTNDSGDFMIWGVPLGEQQIHVDLDLSDMGCFSLRPDEFIDNGYGVKQFKSPYEFKSSEDIDSLPQIVTFDRGIEVYPFWGNDDLCEIGLTRADFDLSDLGIKIEPTALLIGGSFSDDGKNSVNKNCQPRKNMGKKCNMTTQSGKIEAIRFTPNKSLDNAQNAFLPELEEFRISDEINDDGAFAVKLPMNLNYLYTNEFGENDYTNDPNKGIPTASCYRLRFTLTDEGLERVRARASYLAPNIREYDGDENKSYAWSTDWSKYPKEAINVDNNIIFNSVDGDYYPQDYFYRFQYGKVYTVSSFQSLLFDNPRRTLAINDIVPTEDKDCASTVNTFPTNMGIRNTSFNFQLLLSLVLAYIQYTFSVVSLTVYEFIAKILYDIGDLLYIFKKSWGETLWDSSIKVQQGGQMTLPLTIYDECEECSSDDDALTRGFGDGDYCKISEFELTVVGDSSSGTTYFTIGTVNESTERGTSQYNDGSARDCLDEDDECCNSWKMSENSDYTDMNSEVITDPNNGLNYSRFKIYFGGNTNAPIGSANVFISGSSENYTHYTIIDLGGGSYGFVFDDDQMSTLFDITGAAAYFESNPINSGLYGYIVDRTIEKEGTSYSGLSINQEIGCDMYDTLYNEDNTKDYLWFDPEATYDPRTDDWVSEGIEEVVKGIEPTNQLATIGATVFHCDNDRIPLSRTYKKIGTKTYVRKTKTGRSEFRDGVFTIVPSRNGPCRSNLLGIREWYRRQLVGLHFCGGVVNYAFVDNWLSGSLYFFQFKAKIKDKDDGKKVKSCETVVKYLSDSEHQRFYYRSCFFDGVNWGTPNNKDNDKYIGYPTTFVDLGPRDEFIKEICTDPSLDPNCSVSRSIGPTSFKSFGELVAFAVNYKMDVRNADMIINDFFKNKGFYNKGISPFNDKDKFFGKIFNGDVSQLISINSEAGIDGFDLQNQKYMGYSMSVLDPDDNPDIFCHGNYDVNGNPIWGPTPITLKYEDDGVRIRQCLNSPGYLTESAQTVPFYYWDKKGTGFGLYQSTSEYDFDDQCWDYSRVVTAKLQGMMPDNYAFDDTDADDPYLLPPISYDLRNGLTIDKPIADQQTEEFDIVIHPDNVPANVSDDYDEILNDYNNQNHMFTILLATALADPPNDNIMNPTEGRLYVRLGNQGEWSPVIYWEDGIPTIWPTLDPYTTSKQILSTPFMFYFGLRPGKTGLDILMSRFGPKGAFTTVE